MMKRLRLIIILVLLVVVSQVSQAQLVDEQDLIYTRAEKHTVRLFQNIEGRPNQFAPVCTAVLIEKFEGISTLLTAGHCVDEDDRSYFVLSDKPYQVVQKFVSPYTDLAILFVGGNVGHKEPALFSTKHLCLRDKLYNFAYPGIFDFTRTGDFLGEDWYAGSVDFVVIPGCSGSGVFNDDGELEGIVVSYDKQRPVSYYIPIDEFTKFLHQLSVDGKLTTITVDEHEIKNEHIRAI